MGRKESESTPFCRTYDDDEMLNGPILRQCRGPIDTKIFREGEARGLFNSDIVSGGTLMGRMGKAEEVAKVICFLLSDDASYVTGGK